MTEYDIRFVMAHSATDAPVEPEWLDKIAEQLMDYFLDSGHDVIVSTNATKTEIELELPAFTAEVDHEAIRISTELLATAGETAGIKIFMEPTAPSKGLEHTLSKVSTMVSA